MLPAVFICYSFHSAVVSCLLLVLVCFYLLASSFHRFVVSFFTYDLVRSFCQYAVLHFADMFIGFSLLASVILSFFSFLAVFLSPFATYLAFFFFVEIQVLDVYFEFLFALQSKTPFSRKFQRFSGMLQCGFIISFGQKHSARKNLFLCLFSYC